MSQKNETPALILAFLVTAGLVGAGFWWFAQKADLNLGSLWSKSSENSTPASNGATSNATNPPETAAANGSGFAQVQAVPSGLFSYGGSTTWAPIRLQVDSAIQAARPEFRLRYVQPIGSIPGSGTGIQMLIRGELAFSQSSRPLLDPEYQQAQQRRLTLKPIPVAIDGLAVVVNPNLNIPGLTLAQLTDIYTGKITNWQAVGGPNLPIQPLTRSAASGGSAEFFVEQLLKSQPFGPSVQIVDTTTNALRKLAELPGAIYYASAPEVVTQCKARPIPLGRTANERIPPYEGSLVLPEQCPGQHNRLNLTAFRTGQYPLTRNLYVIVNQNGQVEEQAGTAYANLLLSSQGQDLIEKTGFVRIR